MTGLTYRRKMWVLGLLVFGVTAALGAGIGLFSRNFGAAVPPWLMFGGLLIVFAGQAWLAWQWWRPLDDFQKQGHLVSWYWGGMGGAVVMIVWLVSNRAQHSDFGMGAASLLTAQGIGFALYYLVWWMRGRGHAE